MVTIEHIKATLFHLRSELHHSEWEEEEFEPSQNKIISYKLKLALDSLQQLFSQIATIEDMMAALPKFQDFFKQFWHDTPWYMALPDHPALHFFCDIASLLAQERNKSVGKHDTPLGLIELVMPTIQTISNSDNYPDLAPRWNPATQQWEDINIKRVMKTHILGRNLTYLIPLKIIFSLDNAEEPTLFNPYYNLEVHPHSDTDNLSILSEEELQRLQDYSSETQGFFDNFEEHQALLNEAENLLGYLSRLVKALKKNSITGNGSEFAAGERGYIAIFNFMQIYDALSSEQKQEIPEDVKKEIEILREQASNKDKVGSTASCFNTRGEILGDLIAIEENKTILNNIVLRENEKNILTKIIYEQLGKCREKIVSGLDGSDSLFITKWGIEKIEDLHHIKAEIAPLVRDSPFAMNVITGFFESIDDLRNYIQTQPIEHLALFLHFFVEEIWQSILKHQLPDMFYPDYDSDDEENISNIQYTTELFYNLLRDLTIEKIKLCFNYNHGFQKFLEKLILDIELWSSFLSFLKKQGVKQKEFFIAINKDRCMSTFTSLPLLRKITENSVLEVLCLLHSQDYSVIFKMYDELLTLDNLEFTEYIIMALNELKKNNAGLLYQWIETNTAVFLRKINPRELCSLNFSQRDRLYQVLEPALIVNIQSSEDVKDTLSWLNPDQKSKFYNHIKLKIKYLIKTGKDVANILQYLNLEQYKETIPIIKENPYLFHSFQDAKYCLNIFEETEDITFDRLLADFYPIKSAEELATLLNILTAPLTEERLYRFKFRLEIILRDAADFSVLFKKLPFKKLQLFFNAYQEDLINRSWSIDEIITLAEFISPETPLILSLALQENFFQTIIHINFDILYAKTRYDTKFYSIFSLFNLDSFKEIIAYKYDQIETHLENTEGLFYFLSHLSEEQQIVIVGKWAGSKLPFKKETSLENDFIVHAKLNHKDYLIYPFFKTGLLSLSKKWDFELLKELRFSERNSLIQDLGRNVLLNQIKNIKDFSRLLSYLNREGCALALEMLSDDLAKLINSPEDILIIKRYAKRSYANLPPEFNMILNLLPAQEDSTQASISVENPFILENSYKMMSNERESKVYSAQPAQEIFMAELTSEIQNTHKPAQQNELEVLVSFADNIRTPRRPPIDYSGLDVESLRRWGEYPDYVFFTPVSAQDEAARKRKKNEGVDYTEGYKRPRRF